MALLDQLNINPAAILVNIVGFVLLLWAMNKLVFKPIGTVLVEREQDVNSRYDRLDTDQRQMDALKADYEQRLAGIEAEAREKIQSAIKDAQAARDQIVNEAAGRSREMIQRAEAEVAHEREQAMITIRQQVVDLAMGAATKVIGDSLDETRQRRLIDDFITTSTIATAPNVPAAGAVSTGANGTSSGGGAGVYPAPGPADR